MGPEEVKLGCWWYTEIVQGVAIYDENGDIDGV
jgi:hypothetical protein